jgi:RimJ/RimL family protein N-acetyltransferase
MILLNSTQTTGLRARFLRDEGTSPIGQHVINTGNGACFADRWPQPRAVLAYTAENYSLVGDPDALRRDDLRGRVAGFVDAPSDFEPLLRNAFPGLAVWKRLIYYLPGEPGLMVRAGYVVRRLVSTDAHHIWGLTAESAWISKTWGGPSGLALSGYGWGAFADGRLVSVACSFFVGELLEELGVVTELGFRGLGLGVACAGALCQDVRARGRKPSWSTSPDNTASVRVAEKLGFSLERRGRLYVVGVPVPQPPERAKD